MQRLRAFIEHLRDELGVPYPLAHARPWVGPGRHLFISFISAQEQEGLPPELWACVEPQSGVMLLLPPAESFLERVEFDGEENGVVVRLRPSGPDSAVVIDPEVRFGSPVVSGIPTWTLVINQLNKWQQLEIIVTQWRRFEQMSELPGPWLYMATRTALRKEI